MLKDCDCEKNELCPLNRSNKNNFDEDDDPFKEEVKVPVPKAKKFHPYVNKEQKLNIRGEIWKIVCNLDKLKDEMMVEYDKKR